MLYPQSFFLSHTVNDDIIYSLTFKILNYIEFINNRFILFLLMFNKKMEYLTV